jgi:hypothetical protein
MAQTPEFWGRAKSGLRSMAEATAGVEATERAMKGAVRAGGTLKSIFKELASPLAIASGLALGFVGYLWKAVRNSEMLRRGLERVAEVEVYGPQFRQLLGGLDAANKRLRMLQRLASGGAFKFTALADANARIETLTRGALSGYKAMKMVMDVAAAGRTSPAAAAAVVGGAWDDAMSGRSIEGAVAQMREMGVVSASAADRLIGLERAGLRGAGMWRQIEGELKKTNGAADAMKNTLAGLANQLEETKGEQAGSIGEMFKQGEMDGMRAAIAMWEQWGPVLREILAPVAAVANGFARMMLRVTEMMGSIPGLKSAVIALGKAFAILLTALAAVSVAQTGRLLLMLVPLVLKLTLGLLGAATAGGLFGGALRFISMGLLRFLVPIGLIIAALELMGVKLDDLIFKWTGFGNAQGDAATKIRQTTKKVLEQVASLKSGQGGAAGKAEAISKAEENVAAAIAEMEAAQDEQRSSGAQTGIQRAIGEAIRQVTGFDPYTVAEENARQRADEASKNVAAAQNAAQTARTVMPQTPAEYLNDPDYARAAAEAEGLLQDANRLQDKLNEARVRGVSAEEKAAMQGEIDAKYAEAKARMSPERLAGDFEKRLASDVSQAKLTRTAADVTGNEELRKRANALEDKIKTERRTKELAPLVGLNRAKQMAESETRADALLREQGQVNRWASALGRVGGAAGEVGRRGTSEEARLLKDILRAINEQNGGSQGLPDDVKEQMR